MSTDSPSRGVTYVAWGTCIPEAIRSSQSAQKFGLRTCLITTDDIESDAFDRIVRSKEKLTQNFNIVNNYDSSPWDVTLWLDSDTLVLGSLDYAFQMAETHGIAIVIAPHSTLLGRGLTGVNEDWLEYNCGAMWIDKRHPRMVDFGNQWATLVESHDGLGWWTDQSSVSVALHQLQIAPFVLPHNWNFRAFMDREFDGPEYHLTHGFGPIKIWHSRSPYSNKNIREKDGFWVLQERILEKLRYVFHPIRGNRRKKLQRLLSM